LMYDQSSGGIVRSQDRHLWEPFLHKITNGVFAIRTFGFPTGASSAGDPLRNGLILTDLPEPRGSGRPGRRPHVPSSSTDNVKEPTRILPRFDWFRASVVPTKKRRETNACPVGAASAC